MSAPDRLNYGDLAAVDVWLAAVKQTVGDADAIARDMLRPLRARELGAALHRQRWEETAHQLEQLLAYASLPPLPDPEPSDPVGNGGAGPVH